MSGIANVYADTPGERRAYRASVGAACLIHIGSVLLLGSHPPPPRAAAMAATEVELALTPPPPPPPPPPPAAEPPEPAPRPKAAPRAKPAPAPEQPAAPPPLLTAAEDPRDTAPVRFASDPNGRSYSSGLVATGAQPVPPPPLPAAPQPKPVSDGVTPADQLERQPMWRGDDCRGYFPDQAQTDLGRVALIAVVRPDGSIAKLDVASETPPGQGFASAARACIQNQRFAPALDKKGRPTTARTQIGLRFSR